jgi:hypothetical protein
VSGASLEEQAAFLNEFPDFLEDAPLEEKGDLEKDETYQQILQQVR